MVDEDERLADDAGEKADGTVDAGAAELEVGETAELEAAEGGICVDVLCL